MSDRELAREDKQAQHPASCKCFVGGLSWETTGDKLRSYFENWGVVREAFVSYNRANGRPRGFGFVVFLDEAVAAKVVAARHTIDRREVEVKYAVPKDESLQTDDQAAGQQHARGDAAAQGKKIFVGGLAPAVDDKALREHFEEFGAVEDAVVMFDHDRRPRGFGFITFASEESVQAVFARGAMQVIHGKQIEIKPAVPRDMMPPSARGQHTMLYLDPRYGGARHGKGPQHVLNGLHHGLPRHLVPTVDPGQFNSMSALAMQAMAGGFGLQGPEGYGGKQPPGSYDLYGGGVHANGMNGSMNGGNGVFGPSARAALAYLQAQAQLSGMQQAQGGAASKLSGMGALGPSSNGLNLKALALASGLGAAFPPNGSLGAGGDSAAFPDQQQQQQQASVGSEYGAEAAPGVGLGNGDFRYHDASFVPAQTPGWSS